MTRPGDSGERDAANPVIPDAAAPDAATGADTVAGLRFDDGGLIPAIAQQYDTREVLMLAWMDAEAVRRTLQSGAATYFSRSRQQYWVKGETSGNRQRVIAVRYDCDRDCLLLEVDQTGPACHTGTRSCFTDRVLRGGTGAAAPGPAE